MPPHIFHAVSDDPSRQFGCMAALFHLLHHQYPRFPPRKRSPNNIMPPSTTSSAPASSVPDYGHAGPDNVISDTHRRSCGKKNSRKVAANGKKGLATNPRYNSDAKSKNSPERVSNRCKRSSSFLNSPTPSIIKAPASSATPCHEKAEMSSCSECNELIHESPSIFSSSRSTNYTLRQSPKAKCQTADDEKAGIQISAVSSNISSALASRICVNTESSSSPSSPHMPLAQALKEARRSSPTRSAVCKSLFMDKPRAAMDVKADLERTPAAARSCRRRLDEDDHKVTDSLSMARLPRAAPTPQTLLHGLQESVKVLKQFVDGFDTHDQLVQQNAKKNISSSSSWWSNAKSKSRLFKSSGHHQQLCTGTQKYSNSGSTFHIGDNLYAPAAARTSSFDYNEAVRISQKLEETPARLSLDGRELVPKAVMKLREAMRLGHLHIDNSAEHPLGKFIQSTQAEGFDGKSTDTARSTCRPLSVACRNSSLEENSPVSKLEGDARGQRSNVIARLMGLDSLSSPNRENYGGSTDSKPVTPRQTSQRPSLLFKDLLTSRCSPRSKLDQPGGHISASIFAAAEQIRVRDAALASSTSTSKMGASRISANSQNKGCAFVPHSSSLHCYNTPEAPGDVIIKEEYDGTPKVIFRKVPSNESTESALNSSSCGTVEYRQYLSKASSCKATQRRHAKVNEVMPSSILALSCRESNSGSRRALSEAGNAPAHKVKIRDKEDVPTRIVVMESRRMTDLPVLDEFTVSRGRKEVPAKNLLPSAGSIRPADAGNHYIKPAAELGNAYDFLLFETENARSANLLASSKKGDTSSIIKQHRGADAHDNRKSAHAQNHKHLEAILRRNNDINSRPQWRSKKELALTVPNCVGMGQPERWSIPSGRPGAASVDEAANYSVISTHSEGSEGYPKMVESRNISSSCVVNSAAHAGRRRSHDDQLVELTETSVSLTATDEQSANKLFTSDQKKNRNVATGDERLNMKGGSRVGYAGRRRPEGAKNAASGADVVLEAAKLMDDRSRTLYHSSCGPHELIHEQRKAAVKAKKMAMAKNMSSACGHERTGIMVRARVADDAGSPISSLPATSTRIRPGVGAVQPHEALATMSSSSKKTINSSGEDHPTIRHQLTDLAPCNAQVISSQSSPAPIINGDKEYLISQAECENEISKCFEATLLPPLDLFSSLNILSNRKHFVCCNPLDNVSLEKEQSEKAINCWRCLTFSSLSPIVHSIFMSLEDNIFHDLLLEIL
ncbi:hypothetical protein GOP47_0007326 [Adiantum capillus-veneris]|uniref:Uncharacterized protein n=1 Tax=Adiantum capillus-veneris TaxID=13818 RepID=A0A9D4V1X7_ADICA|nr:hypothetical protein GOP47_0007326 [Adiantum capillus-veneris]